MGLLLITIATGIISGSYPAFIISSFSPVNTFKGKTFSGEYSHSALREMLVVVQFTITIVLFIGTFGVYRQLHYMQHKDLGYNPENIIYFYGHGKFMTDYESVRYDLMQYPNILNISKAFPPFFPGEEVVTDISWKGKNPNDKLIL